MAASYTAAERRSANQVWNAAGDYSFEPLFLARQRDGSPRLYLNCVIGFVRKYYGQERVEKLFALWEGDAKQSSLDELVWLYLEHAVYLRELPSRPVLTELRQACAEDFFRQEQQLSRQEWMAKDPVVRTVQAVRWSAVLEKKPPVMSPYEKALFGALTPSAPPEPEQLEGAVLAVLAQFRLFDGMPRTKAELRFRLTGAVAALLMKTRPVQLQKTDRLTVERSSAADALQGGGLKQDKRMAQLTLKRSAGQDRAYIERCFGRSLYSPQELARAERELCSGNHLGCRLWFTDGVPVPGKAPSAEAKHLSEQAELQAVRNRTYFTENLDLHRSMEKQLTDQIRNSLMVHRSQDAFAARSGRLNAAQVWRGPVLEDERIFLRSEEESRPSFDVELLLDASASRLHCQEVIAAQGVILAKSLMACKIPVRVSSFCSLRGYTVLRVLKSFDEQHIQSIFRYFASGWNRDGLVLRAAGDLCTAVPGPSSRHLLILLTDAAPNDSFRVLRSQEHPLGHDYGEAMGVQDAAAEVHALLKKGLHPSAVFMGEDSAVPAAREIYGKSLARIRGMDQLAAGAGRLIQAEIRSLDA